MCSSLETSNTTGSLTLIICLSSKLSSLLTYLFCISITQLRKILLADMAHVDYVFKTVKYGTQTLNLTATVYLPKHTSPVKGIGEMESWSRIELPVKRRANVSRSFIFPRRRLRCW